MHFYQIECVEESKNKDTGINITYMSKIFKKTALKTDKKMQMM